MNPPNKHWLLRFLLNWSVNTLAVALTANILHDHIHYQTWQDLVWASLLLGMLNTFVRPILMLIALPLLIFTLGLFYFVINALLLDFLGTVLPRFGVDFTVSSFGYAFAGAALISIFAGLANLLTGNTRNRITLQRRPPPGPPDDRDHPGSGSGPVIDV